MSFNPNPPMQSNNNNKNFAEKSPGNYTAEFDPYKSINLPSASNLNNAFNSSNSHGNNHNINVNTCNNVNLNEGFQGEIINNTMNLNISEIKHVGENESGNYPEFHQLNRDSIASFSNPAGNEAINPNASGGFNFNNAVNVNNFEANFDDFNNAQNFNNQINSFSLQQQGNNNNFPDKEEFDF